jgi:hypothetical protein
LPGARRRRSAISIDAARGAVPTAGASFSTTPEKFVFTHRRQTIPFSKIEVPKIFRIDLARSHPEIPPTDREASPVKKPHKPWLENARPKPPEMSPEDWEDQLEEEWAYRKHREHQRGYPMPTIH